MRISDWSSDVCSSYLPSILGKTRQTPRLQHSHGNNALDPATIINAEVSITVREMGCMPGRLIGIPSQFPRISFPRSTAKAAFRREGKSVVREKSVTVRVDLGGRRIIKKKKIIK